MMDRRSASPPAVWGIIVAGAVLVGLVVVGLVLFSNGTFGGSPREASPTGATSPPPVTGSAPGVDQGAGREVLPQGTQASDSLPLPPAGGPLVQPPYAASAFASGEVVAGFPVDVMGPLPGADIVQTSISSTGDRMQSVLVARTDASAAEIVAHYRDLWASLGRTAKAGSGETQLAYSGEFDSLTLAIRPPGGTGTVYVVSAVFHVA